MQIVDVFAKNEVSLSATVNSIVDWRNDLFVAYPVTTTYKRLWSVISIISTFFTCDTAVFENML